jgi:Transmembrane domain of unknown function (DUF3566)
MPGTGVGYPRPATGVGGGGVGTGWPPPARPPVRAALAAPASAVRTRKARLRVARVDPWSVMKISFVLSIATAIMAFIAVAVLWSVLDAMGVFDAVGGMISDVTSSDQKSGFDLQSFLSLSRVLGFTTLLGLVDIILVTALATLGSFLYNLAAGFVGGLEVTLAEEE